MIRFDTEQTIERSAADVWAYATDILRHPEWMGVTDARLLRGNGADVGDAAIEHVKLGPREAEVEVRVSASVPARQIAWTVAGRSPIAGDVRLDLEALGPERTRAVWSGWLGLTGIWRILEPLMAAEIRSGEAAELLRLKANLERAGG
jgi:hypothetical protein